MSTLIDRLARLSPEPVEGFISNHTFSAAAYLWGQGILTRAQVVAGLGLTTENQIQLDQLKTYYDGLTTAKKDAFHGRLEALGILLEGGHITPAFYRTQLQLT